jgi:Ca2+-binding RTX toxin-like protein
VRGRVIFLALLAVISLLSATAVASGHRVVKGSKGDDELTMGSAANRVFARAGDDSVNGGGGNDRLRGGKGDDALFGEGGNDRLRGGQDNDLLDGGDGDDYLNGRGDGGDKDRIVCGDGTDVVVLGKNDVVLVEVSASEDADEVETGDEPAGDVDEPSGDDAGEPGDDAGEPDLENPGSADDDGCEKVKRPGGGKKTCASHRRGCEDGEQACPSTNRKCGGDDGEVACPSNDGGCEEPGDDPCAATYRDCDDPVADEPEPDEPAEDAAPDEE